MRPPARASCTASLHAIDPGGQGEVSASHRIWTCHDIGRTNATPVAHDGLLFAADLNGQVHCLDARTGRRVWMHDTLAPIWGCLLLLGDKLLVGNEDGVVHVFRAGR